MSKNLPAKSRSSDVAIPTFPRVLPGQVRAKARANLLNDLDRLQHVIDESVNEKNIVAAVKLKATIGGVLSSQSIPRDVVEEKVTETGLYLRRELGDEVFATLADALTEIWNI